MARIFETPSQTAGPYVHIGCIPSFTGMDGVLPSEVGTSPIEEGARGSKITISGCILDGAGEPVCDAVIEAWQADAAGIYPGQNGADAKVSGFCRFATDKEDGEFEFSTVKPGSVGEHSVGKMAPHISVWIVARGINIGLNTRIYFEDEDNSADPLLNKIEPIERRNTLIAQKTADGSYRFEIRLQGDNETVFLDL